MHAATTTQQWPNGKYGAPEIETRRTAHTMHEPYKRLARTSAPGETAGETQVQMERPEWGAVDEWLRAR